MKTADIYQKVTDRILDLIDNGGKLPWEKPWDYNGQLPCNYASKKPYRGINLIMTAFDEFNSPFYLTANEIKKRKGSWSGKGTLIVFWKFLKFKDKDDENKLKTVPMLKHYYVWNEEQITGIEFKHNDKHEIKDFGTINEVEDIFANMPNKPSIIHEEQDRACYSPIADTVMMPLKGQFKCLESYYKTFAHELIHSTGHEDRLNRDGVANFDKFGSHQYSKEELVAEMGASFIMGMAGLESTQENSASYIKSWRNKIAGDNKLIIQAAGQAQKAVDYVLGTYKDYAEIEKENDNSKAMAV